MKLVIVERLAVFERLEEELRHRPSSPPRKENPTAEERAASDAWLADYNRRHKAMTDARESIAEVVRLRMRTLAHPYGDMPRTSKVQSDADFVIAHLELIYFNSWMSLRQNKGWGSDTNAPNLASGMVDFVAPERRGRILSGMEVQVLIDGRWYNAVVSESGEARGDFWFVVLSPPEWKNSRKGAGGTADIKLWGSGEGDTWMRHP